MKGLADTKHFPGMTSSRPLTRREPVFSPRGLSTHWRRAPSLLPREAEVPSCPQCLGSYDHPTYNKLLLLHTP